jgi:hypothetical protein
VLDVTADRYLLARYRKPMSRAIARVGQAPGRDTAGPGARAVRAPPSLGLWPTKPRIDAGFKALGTLRCVARTLDQKPFEALVHMVETTPLRSRPRGAPAEIVASFDVVRPFFNRARLCRLDAPALCLLLRAFGHAASLVFAVRLDPFAAHCWAELDGASVNESPESLRQYTPILAV